MPEENRELNQADERYVNVADDQHLYKVPTVREIDLGKKYKYFYRSGWGRFWMRLVWWLVVPFIYLINHVGFGFRRMGNRNLKKFRRGAKKGLVTVSNHIHFFDCTMTAELLFLRKTYMTTQKETLEIPVAGKLVKALGGVPIPDNVGYMKYFSQSVDELLQNKRIVHFYPEVAMHLYRTDIRPFKRGAFNFAVRNRVPVLPIVYILRKPTGLYRLYKKRPLFTAVIGTELYADETLKEREAVIELMERTRAAMVRLHAEGVARLKPKLRYENRTEVQLGGGNTGENSAVGQNPVPGAAEDGTDLSNR